jgi:hypothetical protein
MGNRALVIFTDDTETTDGVAVYFHWNGGPESIYSMLDYLASKGGMRNDASYTSARFVQVAGTFLGGTTSLGLQSVPALVSDLREAAAGISHGDNGLYLIRVSGGSYTTYGRFMDGVWLDEAAIKAECLRAERHAYRASGGIMADLATMNDPSFNR